MYDWYKPSMYWLLIDDEMILNMEVEHENKTSKRNY